MWIMTTMTRPCNYTYVHGVISISSINCNVPGKHPHNCSAQSNVKRPLLGMLRELGNTASIHQLINIKLLMLLRNLAFCTSLGQQMHTCTLYRTRACICMHSVIATPTISRVLLLFLHMVSTQSSGNQNIWQGAHGHLAVTLWQSHYYGSCFARQV